MAARASARGGTRYVALLRGVNVGGKRPLPMKGLVEVCTAAGCVEVQTYIQSGNAVFTAPGPLASRLSTVLAEAILRKFELEVPVVVRSTAELARVVRENPFLKSGADPDAQHVAFLADMPTAAQLAGLDPARSPGDAFVVEGRDVYLHLPNGVARTRLTNQYFDSRLKTVSTVRNWRTVLELLALARSG